MRARLRQIAVRLHASYWFIPALMTVGAIVLAIVSVSIDIQFGSRWLSELSWLDISRPDGARELLSSLSSSMIGVAGTVFSITIAAVVYASGSYGPRLLTNFLEDRGNQLSLGVFIATFVYCLMVLRTVRVPATDDGAGFVPELSVLIALVLALMSVGVLVFFLHHVPDSIRINGVMARIGHRLLSDIKKRYPDVRAGPEPSRAERTGGVAVRASRTGYIQIIDHDTLEDVAEKAEGDIWLNVRTGDFVHSGITLLHVAGGDAVPVDELQGAFAVGDSRTAEQDLEYLIDELVEIGTRALSPGINDPFTAITCLHWLGAATTSLGERDLCNDGDGHRYGRRRVHAIPDAFEHFVARGFGSIRAFVASNGLAALTFVDTAAAAGASCTSAERRAMLIREIGLLREQAGALLKGPALAEVEARADGARERLKAA
ncbi:putative membrane protein [Sphingomonas jejuensis]|uniref:Membrane protein n=1 Tax=Sphingomonas jejuensis TaxID=904715 RepID=A0ABX0XKQ1_9SPHN|nr:DUF2254 domain-containing protein [Sphingomonas jejuensis]NJC33805.1 putative membrane protein [Sphingomonas jejuensis]